MRRLASSGAVVERRERWAMWRDSLPSTLDAAMPLRSRRRERSPRKFRSPESGGLGTEPEVQNTPGASYIGTPLG